jgi:hypothetical protein
MKQLKVERKKQNVIRPAIRKQEQQMNRQKIMGSIVFSGDLDPNPDAAADALQCAGFAITRLPEKLRPLLDHPQDDFFEAVIELSYDEEVLDAIYSEIEATVHVHGGMCRSIGPVETDYIPFSDIFGRRIASADDPRRALYEEENGKRS